jgi:hypothetical protein
VWGVGEAGTGVAVCGQFGGVFVLGVHCGTTAAQWADDAGAAVRTVRRALWIWLVTVVLALEVLIIWIVLTGQYRP